ncbi:MAG: hypothetical protein OXF33_07040 [Rhodospirillales bacterium]|nr:hypothetical protein [Rhodospirillales bacterium]
MAPISYWLGGFRERKRDRDAAIKKLELLIWQFARDAKRYWSIDGKNPQSSELESAIKQVSKQIGSELKDLSDKHRTFVFSSAKQLTDLRQAATSEPFEQRSRTADSKRGDSVLEHAEILIDHVRKSRRKLPRIMS